MKQLVTIAENTFTKTNDDSEPVAWHELILVWTEPAYSVGVGGEMQKTSEIGQFRFVATDDQIKAVVASLLGFTGEII